MINFIHNNSKLVLSLPRFAKRIIAMVIDASLCVITLWIALHLRLDNYQFSILQDSLRWTFLVSVMIALPLFWLMGLYKTIFRYSSMSGLVSIFFAISVYGLFYFSVIPSLSYLSTTQTKTPRIKSHGVYVGFNVSLHF